MSLLSDAMETCIIYDKRTVKDGYGGTRQVYEPGIDFKAAIVMNNSIQAQVALSENAIGIYTVTTEKNINLQFRDVFQRASDGKFFRVTTDGDDVKTPESARLNMRQVRAEEWSLPGG